LVFHLHHLQLDEGMIRITLAVISSQDGTRRFVFALTDEPTRGLGQGPGENEYQTAGNELAVQGNTPPIRLVPGCVDNPCGNNGSNEPIGV
jgi:hypothetical protein